MLIKIYHIQYRNRYKPKRCILKPLLTAVEKRESKAWSLSTEILGSLQSAGLLIDRLLRCTPTEFVVTGWERSLVTRTVALSRNYCRHVEDTSEELNCCFEESALQMLLSIANTTAVFKQGSVME